MPKKTYALERNGPARVEIEWRGKWKDVRVRADGAELGIFANKNELEAGREFSLPSGGVLAVQLVRGFAAVELRVMRDGVSVPGSAGDPAQRVKEAAYMLYFIAALNVVLGGLVELARVEFLGSIGAGWASVVGGAIFALLGWQTSKRSRVALSLGIGLLALDTIWLLVNAIQSVQSPAIGGLVARLFFFTPLANGLRGLRELRSGEHTVSAPRS